MFFKHQKVTLVIALFFLSLIQVYGQADLFYYLPENTTLDPSIPAPASVIGYEIGDRHITHDQLVYYFYQLARASDKVKVEIYGYTYEHRPLLNVIITSKSNQQNLEKLRIEHAKLSEPSRADSVDINKIPLVVRLGYSVHGNEASGTNAAPLVAYYLAAAKSAKVDSILQNTIVLIDPCLNPDGYQRFASWVNEHRSKNLVADPNDLEHREPWPTGRTNHYWFDLNRDWLPVQLPESQGRLKLFHEWKPNIQTDHHEMGSDGTFFFQPGVPSRNHPLTPENTFVLTNKIAAYHARALDRNKRLYYSKESYDDFYFGKGSTYPDINGSIGILFEQASSRGNLRETENGTISFPFTIKNQIITSLSTLEAGMALKKDLLYHQKNFFKSALEEEKKENNKAIIFGAPQDKLRSYYLAEMLMKHEIFVYKPLKDVTVNNKIFKASNSFVVPLPQPQYRLVKAMFERRKQFKDSIFYDISAWTMDLAFNLDIEWLNNKNIPDDLVGQKIDTLKLPDGNVAWKSKYAYAIPWYQFNAPALVNQLLKQHVKLKVATKAFTDNTGQQFEPGTILLPVGIQEVSDDLIYELLEKYCRVYHVVVHPIETGLSANGVDLGSDSFEPLQPLRIMLLVGEGVNATEAGEVWHLLDEHFDIPVSLVPADIISRINMNRYNVLVMPDGYYNSLDASGLDNIKKWVQQGGTLIAWKNALRTLNKSGITDYKFIPLPPDSTRSVPYNLTDNSKRSQNITGAIFNTKVDLTNPLLYGYHKKNIALFKNGTMAIESNTNLLSNPISYTSSPLLSGYASAKNIQHIQGTAAAIVNQYGLGRIIAFTDDLNFRAFWYGTNHIFTNALFFGHFIKTK